MGIEITPILPPFDSGIDALIASHARARPNAPAISQMGEVLSWRDFDRRVSAAARAFIDMGLISGDRVGVLAGNSIATYVAIFGIMRAGAIVSPFSTMLGARDLATLIKDAGCRLICYDVASKKLSESIGVSDEVAWREITTLGSDGEMASRSRSAMPCNIIYSSGTTGLPKGIVHTHQARLWAGAILASAFRYHTGAVVLLATPPYTNGSWMVLLPALVCGAHTILMPKFEASAFLEICRRARPTHAFVVPTQFQMILDHPSFSADALECFECLITAGAPMPTAMKARVMSVAPDRLYELWGLTEVVATVITPSEMRSLTDSVGTALPLSEIRLIGPDDEEMVLPATGEIVARSVYQMRGYWERDELNREIQWRDGSGAVFMRTGDIGEINENGYLSIRGRVKDMIISGGLNVFPIDIEDVLRQHPNVTDAAVVGASDQKWGETPVAFIQTTSANADDESVIRVWANERLAKYQRLSDVVVMSDDFPRNTLGKVLKHELLKRYIHLKENAQ